MALPSRQKYFASSGDVRVWLLEAAGDRWRGGSSQGSSAGLSQKIITRLKRMGESQP